jgi:hypothetical protein
MYTTEDLNEITILLKSDASKQDVIDIIEKKIEDERLHNVERSKRKTLMQYDFVGLESIGLTEEEASLKAKNNEIIKYTYGTNSDQYLLNFFDKSILKKLAEKLNGDHNALLHFLDAKFDELYRKSERHILVSVDYIIENNCATDKEIMGWLDKYDPDNNIITA